MEEIPDNKVREYYESYLVEKKELYQELRDVIIAEKLPLQNPFLTGSFPMMDNIKYDERTATGVLDIRFMPKKAYDTLVVDYIEERYHPLDPATDSVINKKASATQPRLYNIVTNEGVGNVFAMHYNNDMSLVIKIVDLGRIYRDNRGNDVAGDELLTEVYNEIRVGFFLNELRYTYPTVVSNNFMSVVDWFISDYNLYPSVRGVGPFQYIISEKLDKNLETYLYTNRLMETLKCALFQLAHALESAWATHHYLHYDLHVDNVLTKVNSEGSSFHDKNYLYTRVYSGEYYRLPQSGTNNTLIKIIDYGRNRMQIPCGPDEKKEGRNVLEMKDLFEHIDALNDKHNHDCLLVYTSEDFGIGEENNRTWDLRRIVFSLLEVMPVVYWKSLELEDPESFAQLMDQSESIFDMRRMRDLCKANGVNVSSLFVHEKPFTVVSMKDILMSPIRELYYYITYEDERYHAITNHVGKLKRIIDVAKLKFDLTEKDNLVTTRFDLYKRWLHVVKFGLVWSSYQNGHNATTFLSSAFFDSLILENYADDIDHDKDVWAGKRPFNDVLPEGDTYLSK